LSNNNEKYYSNFSATFRELNRPFIFFVSKRSVAGSGDSGGGSHADTGVPAPRVWVKTTAAAETSYRPFSSSHRLCSSPTPPPPHRPDHGEVALRAPFLPPPTHRGRNRPAPVAGPRWPESKLQPAPWLAPRPPWAAPWLGALLAGRPPWPALCLGARPPSSSSCWAD
jgi:hypothetical protein